MGNTASSQTTTTLNLNDFLALLQKNKFKNKDNICLDLGGDQTIDPNQFIILLAALQGNNLPKNLSITLSRTWHSNSTDGLDTTQLDQLLNVLVNIQCQNSLQLSIYGNNLSVEELEKIKDAVMKNVSITAINAQYGDSFDRDHTSEVEALFPSIQRYCIRNKYIQAYPDMESVLVNTSNTILKPDSERVQETPKNHPFFLKDVKEREQIINELLAELQKPIRISWHILKSL